MEESAQKSESRWRFEEVIALECALAKDENEEWEALRRRDAALVFSNGDFEPSKRRSSLKRWLADRMGRDPSLKLAADSVRQSLSVAGQLLAAGGFLFGLLSATAALAYTGEAPINVSAFFGFFVLLQGLLAALLLIVFVFPKRLREALVFRGLFRFGQWILEMIFAKAQAMSGRFLSGQQRQDSAELAAAARRGYLMHGSLAKWIAFQKVQVAALFFNLGALSALLVSVAFSDRAFGWQTTLEVSNERVHSMVEVIALPWSWQFGEGQGYPSLSQIEGSRIVLKEGIRSLENENLSAWWRFLALGIVCYGIAPRLLFYALGKLQSRSALGKYEFRNAAVERLVTRLRPAETYFKAEEVSRAELSSEGRWGGSGEDALVEGQRIRCLCSSEFGESFDLGALREAMSRRWGVPVEAVTVATFEDGRLADQVEGVDSDEQIVVVFESWMPPIKELERQLKALRAAIEKHSLIKIVLVGIPASQSEAISLKPEMQYAEVWRSFVRRMGDPYLMLENPAV